MNSCLFLVPCPNPFLMLLLKGLSSKSIKNTSNNQTRALTSHLGVRVRFVNDSSLDCFQVLKLNLRLLDRFEGRLGSKSMNTAELLVFQVNPTQFRDLCAEFGLISVAIPQNVTKTAAMLDRHWTTFCTNIITH